MPAVRPSSSYRVPTTHPYFGHAEMVTPSCTYLLQHHAAPCHQGLPSAPESPAESSSSSSTTAPAVMRSCRRIRNACLQCRKRRTRCSRTFPCAGCVSHGDGDACDWEGGIPAGNVPSHQLAAQAHRHEMVDITHRIERLAGLLGDFLAVRANKPTFISSLDLGHSPYANFPNVRQTSSPWAEPSTIASMLSAPPSSYATYPASFPRPIEVSPIPHFVHTPRSARSSSTVATAVTPLPSPGLTSQSWPVGSAEAWHAGFVWMDPHQAVGVVDSLNVQQLSNGGQVNEWVNVNVGAATGWHARQDTSMGSHLEATTSMVGYPTRWDVNGIQH